MAEVVPYQRDRLLEFVQGPVLNSDLDELIKFIRSQPKGDMLLEALSAIPSIPASISTPVAQGYDATTEGNMSMVNLTVWHKIQIKLPDKGKTFDGWGWGLTPGLPGGVFWWETFSDPILHRWVNESRGTQSYGTESDISGKYDYSVIFLSVSSSRRLNDDANVLQPGIQVNFNRGNTTVMSFKAFGVSTGLGSAAGSGEWS